MEAVTIAVAFATITTATNEHCEYLAFAVVVERLVVRSPIGVTEYLSIAVLQLVTVVVAIVTQTSKIDFNWAIIK